MVNSVTFTVWPTGRQFTAAIKRNDLQEFDVAYKNAHIEAAIIATRYGFEAYVTVGETRERCLFHPCEYKNSQSILRLIMGSGIHHAYWNFETNSWLPLPIDPEADLGHVVSRKLLPPPKKFL